jgi:putative ABC transport system permease protein
MQTQKTEETGELQKTGSTPGTPTTSRRYLPSLRRTFLAGFQGRAVRGGLTILEVTLAVILCVGAGLLLKSFSALLAVDIGVKPENVVMMHIPMGRTDWKNPPAVRIANYEKMIASLASVPGVTDAAMSSNVPLVQRAAGYTGSFLVHVTIINESMSRIYFPNEDPIGKHLKLDSWTFFGERTQEIIGVASDVKHRGLGDVEPLVYLPLSQAPRNRAFMVVKTNGDPMNIVSAVRATIRSMDPDLPLYDIQTLEARIGQSLARDRFSTLLLGTFSALALTLAAVGLYGILSYVIAQRTQEMAIRMALGAHRFDVLRFVLGQGMKPALLGIMIGLAGALAVTRIIRNQLFGITATDPLTLIVVTLLLAVVAFLACYLPARRAMRVDPMTALRYQ